MKTYIGQRGRDKVLKVWIEHHGKRYPMSPDDLAYRILSDVYGLALPSEDLDERCAEFHQALIGPRLQQPQWTLTETEVRAWNANFVPPRARVRLPAADAKPDDATPEADLIVAWGTETTRARILHVTPSVLLLEGDKPGGRALTPGNPVMIGRPGRPPATPARVAANGIGQRYLLALGLRAVRGMPRAKVNLPVLVGAPGLAGRVAAQMVNLSGSGARVRGITLPPGADCELSFVPPGWHEVVTMRSVVVHQQAQDAPPEVGVAFCGASLEFSLAAEQPTPAASTPTPR